MSTKSPWSVKGISPEERDLAKEKAREAGVPIGAWLSQQIRTAAERAASENPIKRDGPSGPPKRFAFGPGQWRNADAAIDSGEFAAAMGVAGAVARRTTPGVSPARVQRVEERMDAISEQLADEAASHREALRQEIEGRFEELIARIDEFSSLEERLLRIGDRVNELVDDVDQLELKTEARLNEPPKRPEEIDDVEQQLEVLSQRLRRLEFPTKPSKAKKPGFFSRLFRRNKG